jgi:hypothetical protein
MNDHEYESLVIAEHGKTPGRVRLTLARLNGAKLSVVLEINPRIVEEHLKKFISASGVFQVVCPGADSYLHSVCRTYKAYNYLNVMDPEAATIEAHLHHFSQLEEKARKEMEKFPDNPKIKKNMESLLADVARYRQEFLQRRGQ